MRSSTIAVLSATLGLLAAAGSASASLTLLPAGPQLATQTGNLVTNGSFETGGPGNTTTYWATGTTLTPFAVPPGWSSSGSPNTYAYWGNNGGSPLRIGGSEVIPVGSNALYFGNSAAAVTPNPTFLPTGEVTFSSTPVFNGQYPSPAVLWQSVPTNANFAPSYLLSFWVSGEAAGLGTGGAQYDGVFGLRVTNVLLGDPMQYFAVPSGSLSPFGTAIRYEFLFTPLNASLPCTVEFYNWGHLVYNNTGTTELVLDDVIVNMVPAPAAATAFALSGLLAGRRRR